MVTSLEQQHVRPEGRRSLVEKEVQDSSTDCTLNNSLLSLLDAEAESSSRPLHSMIDEHKVKAPRHAGASSLSFSRFTKFKSSIMARESISPCCGLTVAETVASSSWSQAGGAGVVQKPRRTLSDLLRNCFCFWPTLHSVEERTHTDCFLAVDCSSSLADPIDWHASYPDTPVFRLDSSKNESNCAKQIISEPSAQTDTMKEDQPIFSPLTTTILSLSKRAAPQTRRINIEEANACQNTKLARLTPITVYSKASFAEYTKNGATMASTSNTLHKRTDDISVGFFTTQTLDAIYSSPTDMNEEVSTPRNQGSRLNVGGNTKSAFQTPGNRARSRTDSETFRRTIDVVTCEKRKITDESDVSPIDSDAGFSPMLDTRSKRVALESLPPRQSPINSSQKRLTFDIGSVRRYDTPNVPRPPPRGRSLFQDSTPESLSQHLSPLSEFGMSVMKSLQSIVQGRPSNDNIPAYVETKSLVADKENTPANHQVTFSTSVSTKSEKPWQDTFLQKSSSFLKALRKTGRRGKVLLQGWVAFRETVSWKEITRDPKRCDFRYIILLDDMPLLHMFSSRPKQKKLMPKYDLLRDCISVDLTRDVAVRVDLVSKEFGNEVCIFDEDTDEHYYGLLPIPMPHSVFLDKHQSRLGKGEALRSIFEPFKRSVSFAPSPVFDRSANDHPATMEQYDVSRHLLFVIDAAIQFPPPRADHKPERAV